MLTVAGDEIGGAAIDGRSLLDEIAREGARRMLVAALEKRTFLAPERAYYQQQKSQFIQQAAGVLTGKLRPYRSGVPT